MKQRTKKLIAHVLLLTMLMTCLMVPSAAFAAGTGEDATGTVDTIKVTVQANPTASEVAIVLEDLEVSANAYAGDESGKVTIADVLAVAHNEMEGYATEDFAAEVGDYGLGITKLFGDTSGCYGYYVNNASAWSLNDEVKDGDFVSAFVYEDKTGWSDKYLYFDDQYYAVSETGTLAMTLKYPRWDAGSSMMAATAEASRTIILTNDKTKKEYPEITDENGVAAWVGLPAGTYTASVKVKSNADYIVNPWAKVTVEADENQSDDGDSQGGNAGTGSSNNSTADGNNGTGGNAGQDDKAPVKQNNATATVAKGVKATVSTTAGGTAAIKAINSKKKTITLKAKIKVDGVPYQVTAINKNAFKKCKKVTKIVLPSTIKKVNKGAFTGAKKLKTVKFTSKKAPKVVKGAFKGLKTKKMTVQVSKKMNKKTFKKFKKELKKAGFNGIVKRVK